MAREDAGLSSERQKGEPPQGREPLGQRFSVALTGDLFIASHIMNYREPEFLKVFEKIRGCDLGFTNLEVLLNDYKGIPAAESGGTYAGAPSSLVEDVKWAGFHMVSRANNHSLDYSYEGLRLTSQALDRAGIAHAGVGETLGEARSPAYLDMSFGRVALLSASSSFASWGRAGHSRPDFQGRPGLSPLRYKVFYSVPKRHIDALESIKQELSVATQKELSGWTKPLPKGVTGFFGLEFRCDEKPGIHSEPLETDVSEIVKWVKDARRQANLVVFSLHAHEAHLDREIPADFIVSFAHRCIEGGVDVFVGHGPHLLRGIEIYQGKPIFYSLGNFVFQNDLVRKHPQEIYQRFGLSFTDTPADIYDTRSKNDTAGFPADPIYWESVVAVLEMNCPQGTCSSDNASDHAADGACIRGRVRLIPIELGFKKPRPERGRPMIARGEKAVDILKRLEKLSRAFGTSMRIEGEEGIIDF